MLGKISKFFWAMKSNKCSVSYMFSNRFIINHRPSIAISSIHSLFPIIKKCYKYCVLQQKKNGRPAAIDHQSSSFLPHGSGTESAPVAVSCDPDPGDHHQILINLQPGIPTWFSRFDRVIEIIYQDDEYEQSKRDNFLFYKQRGYALSYHDLSETFSG